MDVQTFVEAIGADFFTGVPDSLLKSLSSYLMDTYGLNPAHHVIAANEGNAAALAAGYYLATGRTPVVYMQNSGEGNIVNPAASLLNVKVYAIPTIFVVGWRGEPGVKDEPQHVFQGEITVSLLKLLGIKPFILSQETTAEELQDAVTAFRHDLRDGNDVAFVVRKGALTYDGKPVFKNPYTLRREEVIGAVTRVSGRDPVISTTGKASRELFELRVARGESHETDFLTVGSMGHTSSIALAVAVNQPNRKVWCIDGDGAALMHMGAMGVIGSVAPKNLVHILINNEAHESVGGMPTVAKTVDFAAVARACGYPNVVSVQDADALNRALQEAKASEKLTFIEVKCAVGARKDLGRPTTTALENKTAFMRFLATR